MKQPAICLVSTLACAGFVFTACASTTTNTNPTGRIFPSVEGTSLAGEAYDIPADFFGSPTLFLIGYEQDTQFDIDRWLIGINQIDLPVAAYEIPTIEGFVPGLFAGWIDGGMRSGIPDPDQAAVITVYDDAERIVEFTGDEDPISARVLLLDSDGRVVWFHDQGFSPRVLADLSDHVDDLSTESSKTSEIEQGDIAMQTAQTVSVERIKSAFNELNYQNLAVLDEIYRDDVHFQDPLREFHGLDELRTYYADLYRNVESCEFVFHNEVVNGDEVFLTWTMFLRHKTFNGGEMIEVPGASHLRLDGAIAYHRDYFDVGAMVYEHVPVVGFAVRKIKDRF